MNNTSHKKIKKLKLYGHKNGSESFIDVKEEKELVYQIRKGDEKAKRKLIRANLKLVISIAKKYVDKPPYLSLRNLIQEGNLGLYRAIETIERSNQTDKLLKKYRFATYASWWIRQAITRSIAERGCEERRKKILSPDENKELLLYGEKNGKITLIAKICHKDKEIIIKAKNSKIREELLREINQAIQKERYFRLPWSWSEKGGIMCSGFLLKRLGNPGFLEALKTEFWKSIGVGPTEVIEGVLANKRINGYKIKPNLSRIIYKI